MIVAPELADRFRRDLQQIWPQASEPGARLALAVSGGGDSLAMLLLAHAAIPDRIAAATVDHGLREGSAAEAATVVQLCRRIGVPHATLSVAVAAGNLQDRARAARYGALARWCLGEGLRALATAHQLDDQAETLVMRLNRGSGLAGLAGVRARGAAPDADLLLVRPLLGWRRCELASVTEAAGVVPAVDPSNDDDRFERVRVRKALGKDGLLDPVMVARSAAMLGEAEAYVTQRIDAAFRERATWADGEARLSPGSSDFEAIELAGRIVAGFGRVATRTEVAAMVARLRRGENASLGGVLAKVRDGAWIFAAEPARGS